VQKYPDVNVQMAHNALLYFNDFNREEKISFLDRGISLKEMESRLRAAVVKPEQVFKAEQKKTLLPKKNSPQQNKKNGRKL